MKKLLFLFSTLFTAVLTVSTPAFAASTSCTPIYGGGQSCVTTQVSINKQVQDPSTGNFIENLGSDKAFGLNGVVTFRIMVTNNGNTNLTNVTVTDTLPAFTQFNAGPGTVSGNTLTFNLGTLGAGQTSSPTVLSVKVTSLPSQNMLCEPNTAQVTTNEGQSDQDTAQFCIQNQVVGAPSVTVFPAPTVVKTPPTGPEALPLLALLPTGFFGALLRKKTSK